MGTGSVCSRGAAGIAILLALVLVLPATSAQGQKLFTLARGGTTVSLPPTQIGQNATTTVTLNVSGPFPLATASVSGDFSLAKTNCNAPVALNAGDSCLFELRFAPTAAGLRSSSLLLTSDTGSKIAFGLAGIGVRPALTFVPGIAGRAAGTGTSGYSGDGGAGISAELNYPMGVARDSLGNLYIADSVNNVIRKIDVNGIITTIAGNGTQGYSGDGGPATSATLGVPTSVAVDAAGNLYIADFLNSCVRKVDVNGVISTLATGALVRGVLADPSGNVYFSSWIEGVWKVDTQGVSTRIAGNGYPGFGGDGGPATEAQMSGAAGLALDSQGNLYVAELLNSDIRKIDAAGIISTVVGNQQAGFSGDGGPAKNAQLNGPTDVALDAADSLYIADSGNNRIRKVNASGNISSIAGDGNFGYAGDSGSALLAQFAGPASITLDGAGNLFIADTSNHMIRKVRMDASTIDFGKVTVGETGGPVSVIVSNAGNADLTVNTVLAPTDFVAQTNCPTDSGIKPGAECVVNVSFMPSANGNMTGTVNVNDDAAGSPHAINVQGNGYIAPQATDLVIMGQYAVLPINSNLGVVAVDAMDVNGHLVADFSETVTLQLQGPAGFAPHSSQVQAVNGMASFDLSGVILNVAGSYTITVTSPGLNSMQVSFDVVGTPDFSIGTSKSSLTVEGSGTGSLSVTITPKNGFSGNIALSCSGLPAYATCSFSPSALHADGSDAVISSILTISTGTSQELIATNESQPASLAAAGTLGTGILAFVCAPLLGRNQTGHSRRRRAIQAIGVLTILMVGLVGCGTIASANHRSPAGTYTVSVTGSSAVTRSGSFTLVVK